MLTGLLSILIFIPLIGAGVILLLPKAYKQFYRWIAIIVQALIAINLWNVYLQFEKFTAGYQMVEQVEWIRLSLGKNAILSIDYILGIDGISLSLLILTLIVFSVASLSSFKVDKREKTYFALLLVLMSAVIGCFVSLDLFLFFVFFEFMLLPMYFLIGIWGGPNRSYASLKFIIYTLVGSVFILVGILALSASYTDEFFTNEYKKIVFSFDFRILEDFQNLRKNSILSIKQPANIFGISVRSIIFMLMLVGFGIKLPIVPFHTWLPDAHVEASTPNSVILAGILLKIGGYGFLRILYGFMPDMCVQHANFIGIIGLISIIYGGFNALAQSDLKKLIAYSSVAHMGFVIIGFSALNAEGFGGAVFQMFSHGILSSLLFLIVGVLYDRTRSREIKNYKGLIQKMPIFSVLAGVAFFASLGLPGFSGFVGEFFTLFGAFQSLFVSKWIVLGSVFGILISAVYFLWTYQKVFFGEYDVTEVYDKKLTDINNIEKLMLGALCFLTLFFGLNPGVVFSLIDTSINHLLK